eukprot:TRINITY_DN5869_c0_g1::TRINITY_DN5869_c0_g1_i1::g.24453::m.24453 TRINITY_DN5869_c0_g1::TRINITY_DN5869_c0_g1_i1::g.24453  ORF type:complete len:458 (-),score=111.05,sp/Q9NZT1/CALL5_HUMAN/27.17/5e-09,sp/Q9NZT1/CALL5_HUMAN/25.49/2e-07,EF-hand_7/PF13499.1/1.9e-11,EF-hand_7/PF13499.1/4.5e-10,EF-hand_7/PF13499.1/18,EF-hand_7/PF13499.1/1.4e-10,EF-hand_1/PF00036.27/3.1e-05,EF-hand_1/PF00036.27/0.0058,EF-hand_1/PF00036.27/2.3e-05,EF-hand_1/PF00036.27/0.0084,EF-hand_1/PF00036.27/56,EF-hand_1/PF00036.27/0.0
MADAAKYKIPPGFAKILKDFTREILRHQPVDIYEFGYNYFCNLLNQGGTDTSKAEGVTNRVMSAGELEDYLMQVFLEADQDHNGYLDRKEFLDVLEKCELGLSEAMMLQILEEADENADGRISYREFIPIAVELVQAIYAKLEAKAARTKMESEADSISALILVHGMTQEELEGQLRNIFAKADTDGSGQLSRMEFKNCLLGSDLGLTRQEVNVLMTQVDKDYDGVVTYDEFLPVAIQLLREAFKRSIMKMQHSGDEIHQFLMKMFMSMDSQRTGFLPVPVIRQCLMKSGLGLSRVQIHTVLAEGEMNDEGMLKYTALAERAAILIHSMLDLDKLRQRLAAVEASSRFSAVEMLRGLTKEELEENLMNAFQQADKDGSGHLDRVELYSILAQSGFNFQQHEVNALVFCLDEDDDGRISYHELVTFAYDILLHLAREDYVQHHLANEAA